MDHLMEDPNYYDRLGEMEKSAGLGIGEVGRGRKRCARKKGVD